MKSPTDKVHNNQGSAAANNRAQKQGDNIQSFSDNRYEAIAQRRLKAVVNNSPQVKQMAAWKTTMQEQGTSQQRFQNEPLQNTAEAALKEQNHTGLPHHLKTGIENLSGVAMDDVRVHYNSGKPAQLYAHAYAQGTDIHIAPGQERHLPHEAWHTVQQKQGRVKPMLQLKSGVYVNHDAALEHEADTMGERSNTLSLQARHAPVATSINGGAGAIVQRVVLSKDVLNVVGELHDESDKRKGEEKEFCEAKTGSSFYSEEGDFLASDSSGALPADTPHLQVNFELAVVRYHTKAMTEADEKNTDLVEKLKGAVLLHIAEFEQLYRRYKEIDPALKTSDFVTKYAIVNELKAKISTVEAKAAGLKFLESEDIPKATYDQASTARGIAMHNAAQARYLKKGVWKIGDAHVGQIQEAKLTGNYNLVPRHDFNEEYKDHKVVIERYKKEMEEKRKVEAENERLRQEKERLEMMKSLRSGDKKENTPVSDAEKESKARIKNLKKLLEDDDEIPPPPPLETETLPTGSGSTVSTSSTSLTGDKTPAK